MACSVGPDWLGQKVVLVGPTGLLSPCRLGRPVRHLICWLEGVSYWLALSVRAGQASKLSNLLVSRDKLKVCSASADWVDQ